MDSHQRHRCPYCGRFVENDADGYYAKRNPQDDESDVEAFCNEAHYLAYLEREFPDARA